MAVTSSAIPSTTDTTGLTGLGGAFSRIKPEDIGLDMKSVLDYEPSTFDTNSFNVDVDTNTTPWYQDGKVMQGYAGLASALLQAAALPSQLKTARLQQDALRQNIQTAKEDQARRNTAIDNINRPRSI